MLQEIIWNLIISGATLHMSVNFVRVFSRRESLIPITKAGALENIKVTQQSKIDESELLCMYISLICKLKFGEIN